MDSSSANDDVTMEDAEEEMNSLHYSKSSLETVLTNASIHIALAFRFVFKKFRELIPLGIPLVIVQYVQSSSNPLTILLYSIMIIILTYTLSVITRVYGEDDLWLQLLDENVLGGGENTKRKLQIHSVHSRVLYTLTVSIIMTLIMTMLAMIGAAVMQSQSMLVVKMCFFIVLIIIIHYLDELSDVSVRAHFKTLHSK